MTFRTIELHDISCDIPNCSVALSLGTDPESAEREGWEQSVPIGSKAWDLCPEHSRALDTFLTGVKWEMPTEAAVEFTDDETSGSFMTTVVNGDGTPLDDENDGRIGTYEGGKPIYPADHPLHEHDDCCK